jgi:hypothetical protein
VTGPAHVIKKPDDANGNDHHDGSKENGEKADLLLMGRRASLGVHKSNVFHNNAIPQAIFWQVAHNLSWRKMPGKTPCWLIFRAGSGQSNIQKYSQVQASHQVNKGATISAGK